MASAESAYRQPLRPQGAGIPVDHDVVRDDRRVGAVPCDAAKAHRARNGPGRCVDGDAPAALRNDPRDDERQPAFAQAVADQRRDADREQRDDRQRDRERDAATAFDAALPYRPWMTPLP